MSQSIFIHVGQCGNQIAQKFWDLALKEHSIFNKDGIFDNSMSSFFQNCNQKNKTQQVGSTIQSLRARAILIDMEEGVLNEIKRGRLSELFDNTQILSSVSGSGNNWAVGYHFYGNDYSNKIIETIRKSVEYCDSMSCFFITHSMGGGTGSGLGSKIMHILSDEYEKIQRISLPIYPSSQDPDDVITSPYNSVLATNIVSEFSDLVIPIENKQLFRMVNSSFIKKKSKNNFDSINSLIASLLLNLTSSSRLDGILNMDLGELPVNLVPLPRLNYVISSQSPIFDSPRSITDSFNGIFSLRNTFIDFLATGISINTPKPAKDLMHVPVGTTLSCCICTRGNLNIYDIRSNLDAIISKRQIFTKTCSNFWKISICSAKPLSHDYAILALRNSGDIVNMFQNMSVSFKKLYKRKAHLHHYLNVDGMDESYFNNSIYSLQSLINDYKTTCEDNMKTVPRMKI
ncbi:Epsilon-tubulin, partial [Intoshia linei]